MRAQLVGFSLIAALLLLPGAASAHGEPVVAVTGHPHPDGPISVSGDDFEANDLVRLELRRKGEEPIALGTVPVSEDGTFEITLHLSAEVRPGLYELVAIGGDETVSAEATILGPVGGAAQNATAAVDDVTNNRPAGETVGLAIATALIALAGGAIVLFGRRERTRRLAEGVVEQGEP